jgi:hypothetical protein
MIGLVNNESRKVRDAAVVAKHVALSRNFNGGT